MDPVLIGALILLTILSLVQIALLLRRPDDGLAEVKTKLAALEQAGERFERLLRDEMARSREEAGQAARQLREETSATLKGGNDSLLQKLSVMSAAQQRQLEGFAAQLGKLTETNQQKLDQLRLAVEQKLAALQEDNSKQLEKMRLTVDEKLQSTLEQRLGESFRQVGERLEQVHRGLGEMQALATGVGDLKKVLTNVKSRGTWGEVQLGSLLEQVLAPEQYATNVATRDGGERVEFAVRLPGRADDRDEVVWLPIDAKYPLEDYQRLLDAQEKGDALLAETAMKQLESRLKLDAATIRDKYLNPPRTTDFAILFVPTEGLFAEILRRPGLTDLLQRDCRVMVAGPTTLWSLLNSLQMGFRTLAIEKRSSEVWNLLGAVKTEWAKYGDVLAKVQKKLQEASNTIDSAQQRSRAVGRKLKTVQELPLGETEQILMLETLDTGNNREQPAPEV
ncbi:MAG: DNA recombination protein RmuC [Desulfuromonadales bacterium]|nr:DNA recombination protein RmuC [Desulfuromonadales bacterium]